jgi:dephospho-CoA kinase
VLGLVGPAGAGKSTVARAFAAQGARVVDADRLGHEVTQHDAEVRAALIAEYGETVYRSDGTLDRAQVAERVFRDPAALQRLNQLVHPRILTCLRGAITEAESEGYTGALVFDAALLLDWGFEAECDAVLAVLAPREQQIARLTRTRGWTADEAARRLSAARSDDSFRALADHVVMNDDSEAKAVADASQWLAAQWAARDAERA